MNYLKILKNTYITKHSSDIRNRILKGAYWNSIGTIVTRLVTTILSISLANKLGSDQFGEYGIIMSTNATVAGFAGLGLGATLTRYIANLRGTDADRVAKVIAFVIIVAVASAILFMVLYYLFSPWIALHILAAPQLSFLLQISAVTMSLSLLKEIQASLLTGLEEFRVSSIAGSTTAVLQSILVFLMGSYFGIKGAVFALLIASVLTVVVYYFTISITLRRIKLTVQLSGSFKEWRILFKYSLPAYLATFTVAPVSWIANSFLAKQPQGYGQLGLFNAALQWEAIVTFLPVILSGALFPVMSELYGKGDYYRSYRLMSQMMKYSAMLIIPFAAVVSVFSPLIMQAYGESYKSGNWVVVIIAVTTVFSGISIHLGTFLMASGRMWLGFKLNIVWSVIFLILSYNMVMWGASGLAGARLLAYVIHFFISLILARKIKKTYA